MYGLKSIKSS